MAPDRIAIVGISASGKSTFARRLAERTGLPVLHGDRLEWLPDWRVRPGAEIETLHAEWTARPRWIIEGWIDIDRVARLNAADVVVDLDYSRWRCAGRVLLRMLRGHRRPEMPAGCIDRLRPDALDTVFRKKERPFIDAALHAATMKTYVRLRSPREADRWLTAPKAGKTAAS